MALHDKLEASHVEQEVKGHPADASSVWHSGRLVSSYEAIKVALFALLKIFSSESHGFQASISGEV